MDLFSSMGIELDDNSQKDEGRDSCDSTDPEKYVRVFHLLMKWKTNMSPYLLRIYNRYSDNEKEIILKDQSIKQWIQIN